MRQVILWYWNRAKVHSTLEQKFSKNFIKTEKYFRKKNIWVLIIKNRILFIFFCPRVLDMAVLKLLNPYVSLSSCTIERRAPIERTRKVGQRGWSFAWMDFKQSYRVQNGSSARLTMLWKFGERSALKVK